MKKNRIWIGMLLALFLVLAGEKAVCAGGRTVTVAVLGYPNYIVLEEDGKPYGYAVEYLEEISEYTGWKYRYLPMSFQDAQEKLQKGEIDIVAGNQYDETRAKQYDFSKLTMGYGGSVLCSEAGEDKFAYNDFKHYGEMRIGAMKGTIRIRQFKDFLKKYKVHPRIIEYDTDEEVKEALKTGEVDTLLMSSVRCEAQYRIVANIDNTPLYFTCNPYDKTIKKGIDLAQEKIHIADPYYEQSLQKKYYGNILQSLAYTKEEKEYIKKSRTLKLAVCKDWAPYSYYNKKEKKYEGIVIDLFRHISQKSGMQFEYLGYNTVKEMNDSVKNGEADLISVISADRYWAEERQVRVTGEYIADSLVTIYPDNRRTEKRLALVKDLYTTSQIEEHVDGFSIVYYQTVSECVNALRNKEADYTLVSTYEADYYLDQLELFHMGFRTLTNFQQRFAIGVAEDAPLELYQILSKELKDVSDDELKVMVRENTETNKKFGILDMMYTNPFGFFLIITAFLTVILVLFVLVERDKINKKRSLDLEKADAAKTKFLSHMSHEMRTPLNGINGILGILKERPDLKDDEYIEKALLSARHLTTLINNVLDMSKMEVGKLWIQKELVPVELIVKSINAIIEPLAVQKGISYLVDTSGITHVGVYTDEQRIQQIIINVLSNAVKYTNTGGRIQFILREVRAGDGTEQLEVEVRDTGIGMSKEFCAKAFEPFAQAEKEFSSSGTGLGLAITGELVEKMGGNIELESELGVGTTVRLTCVVQWTDDITKREKAQELTMFDFTGKTALIVEDNEINTEIAKVQLRALGMETDCAQNGQEGIDKFAASPEGGYDIIFMDIMMPVKSGLEAAGEIRAMDREDAKTVPIVAMTANAFAEDIHQSMKSGMNYHLSKPFEKVKIQQILGEAFGKLN